MSKFRLFLMMGFLLSLAAYGVVQADHSWGGYHWARTTSSFTLKVGDNLTSAWKPYLTTSISDWSKSTVIDLVKVTGGATGKKCSATAGRVEVCNAAYGRNGWLGLAQIWLSNGHISQGTAKMNDTYFALAQYNNSAEKNHVMCQEVGHTFGLGHQSETGEALGTCMDYSSDAGSQHPDQHDYAQLQTIYSHTDSFNGATALPDDFANANVENRADWGRLVSSSARVSVYERDFGNGQRILTHVYWADDRHHEHHDH